MYRVVVCGDTPQVTSPGGTKVFSAAANDGKKFEFQAHERGLYRFCFINPSSTPETISFYIHVGHVPGIEDLAKDGEFVKMRDFTGPWHLVRILSGPIQVCWVVVELQLGICCCIANRVSYVVGKILVSGR
jgi:hypothetical protein